ncbi:MAG: hypothetical protein BWY99_02924 [Synergistetes bacterium ADurb.BinA166]|nr:MAG: hypothetical protein BWY99_02924 [Synergistetes bacterium ADurb.BinA166]
MPAAMPKAIIGLHRMNCSSGFKTLVRPQTTAPVVSAAKIARHFSEASSAVTVSQTATISGISAPPTLTVTGMAPRESGKSRKVPAAMRSTMTRAVVSFMRMRSNTLCRRPK